MVICIMPTDIKFMQPLSVAVDCFAFPNISQKIIHSL